jgi:putative component of toxin-antitoxin plasmid stabilization module
MIEVRKTAVFTEWLKKLRDPRARAKIRFGLTGWRMATPAMLSRSGKGLANCEFTMAPAIEFIL